MESFVETRPTKYVPGQRLRADTVNWIIDSIGNTPVAAKYTADDRQAIIRDTRPEEPAPEEPRPARPFDLSTSYENGSPEIVVTNCEFHDGGSLTKLADKTIEDTDGLSSIFLYKEKLSDDWQIATNVEVESADIQIMLYQISSYELSDSNGVPVGTSGERPRAVTVAMDYRDTMNTVCGCSGGGGGGGDCSCDVSAYFTSGDKLATWTNGAKTVDIYSNVLSNDIRDIRNRIGYTPFFYDVSQQRIINNFFYVNRTLHEIHSSGYVVD